MNLQLMTDEPARSFVILETQEHWFAALGDEQVITSSEGEATDKAAGGGILRVIEFPARVGPTLSHISGGLSNKSGGYQ
ncbi:MAG: hypothetical protein ACE14M_03600 [Terriglobales bacterium]